MIQILATVNGVKTAPPAPRLLSSLTARTSSTQQFLSSTPQLQRARRTHGPRGKLQEPPTRHRLQRASPASRRIFMTR